MTTGPAADDALPGELQQRAGTAVTSTVWLTGSAVAARACGRSRPAGRLEHLDRRVGRGKRLCIGGGARGSVCAPVTRGPNEATRVKPDSASVWCTIGGEM